MVARHKRLKETLRNAMRRSLRLPKNQKLEVTINPELGEARITWVPEDTSRADTEVARMAQRVLTDVHQRLVMNATKDSVRDWGRRETPWADVHDVWSALGEEVPSTCSRTCPGAFVSLKGRLQQLVATVPPTKWLLHQGRLVCRMGMDNTTRWKKPIEVVAVSITSSHSLLEWETLGVFFAKEKGANLAALLAETPWDREIPGLTVQTPDGKTLGVWPPRPSRAQVEVVVVADHMARVAMGEADHPNCERAHYRMCCYCDATPDELHNWARDFGEHPIVLRPREGACLPSVDRVHRAPDIFHGLGRAVETLRSWTEGFLRTRVVSRRTTKKSFEDLSALSANHRCVRAVSLLSLPPENLGSSNLIVGRTCTFLT